MVSWNTAPSVFTDPSELYCLTTVPCGVADKIACPWASVPTYDHGVLALPLNVQLVPTFKSARLMLACWTHWKRSPETGS